VPRGSDAPSVWMIGIGSASISSRPARDWEDVMSKVGDISKQLL
jgi:hypothetical protein